MRFVSLGSSPDARMLEAVIELQFYSGSTPTWTPSLGPPALLRPALHVSLLGSELNGLF